MKKYFLFLFTIIFIGLGAFLLPVSAQNLGGNLLQSAQKSSGYEQANQYTFAEKLGRLVQVVLSFVGIVFMALMVYAGYLWMTARGESDQIDKAKNIIRASIIGLVVTIGAYSIAAFIVPAILATQT